MKSIALLIMASLLLLSSAGCNPASRSASNDQKPSVSPEDYPKLASALFQLAQADDPQEFSKAHEWEYTQGRVLVMLELQNGQNAVPSGYNLEVTSQYQNKFDVFVPVAELLRLAKESQIRSIRPTNKPHPHS